MRNRLPPKPVKIRCYTCKKRLGDPDLMGEYRDPQRGISFGVFFCDEACYQRAINKWSMVELGVIPPSQVRGAFYPISVVHGIKNGSLVADQG